MFATSPNGRAMLRSTVALIGLMHALACGHDQRSRGGSGAGDDGDPAAATGGSGASSSGGDGFSSYVIERALHSEILKKREAGTSCGAQLGDVFLALSSLGERIFVTRTALPVDAATLSQVTDEGPWLGAHIDDCFAIPAGDRVYFAWSGTQGGAASNPTTIAVDRSGTIVDSVLGFVDAVIRDASVWSAAAHQRRFAVARRPRVDDTRVEVELFDRGRRVSSPSAPLAVCAASAVAPSIVVTPTGFAVAFICFPLPEEQSEPLLVTSFIVGTQVETHTLPLVDQTRDLSVALTPHYDGRVFVAYGMGEGEDARASAAHVLRVTPSIEFGFTGPTEPEPPVFGFETLGELGLENQGLTFVSRNPGLVLFARRERHGEDRPPDDYVDYCFLDDTALPLQGCGMAQGDNLLPMADGIFGIERHRYAPILSFRSWYETGAVIERVLFDVGLEVPRGLFCRDGDCEMLTASFSQGPFGAAYKGYGFHDLATIGDSERVRTPPLAHFLVAGTAGRQDDTGRDWAGGSAHILSLGGPTGPSVARINRDSFDVVADVPPNYTRGPWRAEGGYRVFGRIGGQMLSGLATDQGSFSSASVDILEWDTVHRCGERTVNATHGEVYLSTDETATEFTRFAQDDSAHFEVLGCTNSFLLRQRGGDGPFETVGLEDEAVSVVPQLTGVTGAARTSLLGDHLAVFWNDGRHFQMAIVGEAGLAAQHRLTVSRPLVDEPPDGWRDAAFHVPAFIDDDLGDVSIVWAGDDERVYLSSWRFVRED